MRSVRREFSTFVIVGFIAAGAHYSTLFILVEGAHWRPVPSTLVGFVCGGFVSYILNRRHTFASDRPHEEAAWRFATASAVGVTLTWIIVHVLVARLGARYLPAPMLSTGLGL